MNRSEALTVDEAGYAPGPDLGQRLDHALGRLDAPELAGLLLTAGLAAAYEQLQRTRNQLGAGVDREIALRRKIAHLTDEARRWKRRHGGAVTQARKNHHRATLLESACGLYETGRAAGEEHRANLQENHDQALAVLKHVLGCFTEEGHPVYAARRSAWVSLEQLDTWRQTLAFTPQRPWWEQLQERDSENAQLRLELAAERLANEELRAELADLRLAASERQGERARRTPSPGLIKTMVNAARTQDTTAHPTI